MPAPRLEAGSSYHPLSGRLAYFADLPEREFRIVQVIEHRLRRSVKARTRLAVEGAEMAPICVMAGWAARVRELSDGRRQLVGVILPGDVIGLSARPNAATLANVVALTNLKTAEAPELAGALRQPENFPALAAAMDLCAAEEEAFLLYHLVRLGRQTAYERLAHLLLEFEHRMAQRGLGGDGAFDMPLTQETLGDILGLSIVHVNRTLQQMRRQQVIEFSRGRVKLLNKAALVEVAEFRAPQLTAG